MPAAKHRFIVDAAIAFAAFVSLGCLSTTGATSLIKPVSCSMIDLSDPVAAAEASIAVGDLSVFPRFSNWGAVSDGVFCPTEKAYRALKRQRSSEHDAACRFPVSEHLLEVYNATVASSTAFQVITGCRPATYCETRYSKDERVTKESAQLDPRCPNEPTIIASIAVHGSAQDLAEALARSDLSSPEGIDMLTFAAERSFAFAQWDAGKTLIVAGADIDGRAHSDGRQAISPWMEAPLEAVFNQSRDTAAKLDMARWLLDRGASFANPDATKALGWAIWEGEEEAFDLLVSAGAPPNGPMPAEEVQYWATQPINVAGQFGMAETAFYAALHSAVLSRGGKTPDGKDWATEMKHQAKRFAVRLYEAGGRFLAGRVYGNQLNRDPDIDVISLLLAAAHREGRLRELAARLAGDMERVIASPDAGQDPSAHRRALAYIRSVEACPAIRPTPAIDHIDLCP